MLKHVLLALCIAAGCAPANPPPTTQPAQPAQPVQPSEGDGFYRTRIGSAELTVVSDGMFSLDVAHGLAIDAKPGEIQTSPIDAAFNEFVVAANGHVALIDTGAAANMGPTAGKLQASLRNAGIRAEDITDVFLTHVHPDHDGGLIDGGKPAFPNATIHVDANDVAYWMDPARAAAATGMAATFFASAHAALAPKTDKLKTFTGATEFFPGFRAVPAYGHTPGHVNYVLESGGQTLVFLGDLIHIPAVQFADPDVAVAFDVDPAMAVATRRRVLGDAADKDFLVAHNHVAFPGLGHVRRDGHGFRWTPSK